VNLNIAESSRIQVLPQHGEDLLWVLVDHQAKVNFSHGVAWQDGFLPTADVARVDAANVTGRRIQ